MKHTSNGVAESNKRRAIHNMCGTSTYQAWRDMRYRCLSPKCKRYADYGGRGITICEQWNYFKNFFEDMGIKPDGMSLGRIHNNKGYYKENCRWENREQQMNNSRQNRFITNGEETLTVVQWARKIGLKESTMRNRVRRNEPSARMFFKGKLPPMSLMYPCKA